MSVLDNKIRVLFAGSHEASLAWLKDLIQAQHDMSVVRDEDLAPLELLLAVREARPDVVILRLPEEGVESGVCSNLLSEYPRLLVLALSQRDQAFLFQQSILKQALTETTDNGILRAIRTGEVI